MDEFIQKLKDKANERELGAELFQRHANALTLKIEELEVQIGELEHQLHSLKRQRAGLLTRRDARKAQSLLLSALAKEKEEELEKGS